MFKMDVTNKKTGETKVVNVPNAVGEAVVYGGVCAVWGVVLGFVCGAVRDVRDVLKKDK